MILSCPACATQYTIAEAQLGPNGRKVRCAACKNTWHAEKPEVPIDLSFSDPKRKPVEDLKEVKAKKLPLKYRAMLEDKKRLKALAAEGLMWGGLAAAMAAILLIGFVLRVDIVRAFPRIAGAYAMVGLKVNGTNLDFGTYTASTSVKGGRFVVTIKAQVKNLSDKPTPVPPVRVKLYDATLQQFDTIVVPPSGLIVDPHATRTLVFDVPDPKNLTASLALDFDLVAMKKMKATGQVSDESAATLAVVSKSDPDPTAAPTETQVPDAQILPPQSSAGGDSLASGPVPPGSEESQTLSNKPLPVLRPALSTVPPHEVAKSSSTVGVSQ